MYEAMYSCHQFAQMILPSIQRLSYHLRQWMCARALRPCRYLTEWIPFLNTPENLEPVPAPVVTDDVSRSENMRPIALVIGGFEYSSAYYEYITDSPKGCSSPGYSHTQRVRKLRELLGPRWTVISVGALPELPSTCLSPYTFDFPTRSEIDLTPIRRKGFTGQIEMVFLDNSTLPVSALEERYPNPLALIANQETQRTVVWIPDSATCRLLLHRNRPSRMVQVALRPAAANPWHLAHQLSGARIPNGSNNYFSIVSTPQATSEAVSLSDWTQMIHHPVLKLTMSSEPTWGNRTCTTTIMSEHKTPQSDTVPSMRPIILVVGSVELSDTGLQQIGALTWQVQATHRIRGFRKLFEPDWEVVVLTTDPWYQQRRAYYSTGCVPVPYGTGQGTSRMIRRQGFHGPIRHVLFDYLSVPTTQLCQRYSQPLECFGWADMEGPCAVWLPHDSKVMDLVKKTPKHLCKGQGWLVNHLLQVLKSAEQNPEVTSQAPPGICIIWNGRSEAHDKKAWKKQLAVQPPRRWQLPHTLRYSVVTAQMGEEPAVLSPPNLSVPVNVDRQLTRTAPVVSPKYSDPEPTSTVSSEDTTRPSAEGFTDMHQHRKLCHHRRAGGPHLPALDDRPDLKISHFYSTCKQNGVPAERTTTGAGGVKTTRNVAAHEVLMVIIGQERLKPRKNSTMPQISLPNGRWLRVLKTEWDVGLFKDSDTMFQKQHEHLMPWLHLTDDPDRANCQVTYSDTGHPLISAVTDISKDTWLVAYLPERVELPPPLIAIPEAHREPLQHVTSTDENISPDPGEETRFKITSNARGIWARSKQPHNLGLLTLNINGKWDHDHLMELLRTISVHPTHRVDGIVLIDTRVPSNQAMHVERTIKRAFTDRAVYVNVLPAQPGLECSESETRHELVGGSTVIVFTRPNLDVWQVTHDPSRSGVLTRVHLKVGADKTLLWLAAYVPHSGRQGKSSLATKLGEWHQHSRRPHHVQDLDEEVWSTDKFDAIKWVWALVDDSIARSKLNSQHIGVILMGDLNQRLHNTKDKVKLEDRFSACGLTESLAEIFQMNDSIYPTHRFGDPGTNIERMIDHVSHNLPHDMFRGGGSPTGELWRTASDHLAIVGLFYIPAILKSRRRRVREGLPAVVFDLSSKEIRENLCEQYGQAALAVRESTCLNGDESVEEVGNRLEYASRVWADIGRKLHKKTYGPSLAKRKPRKSTYQQGVLVAIKYVGLLHKLICGYRGSGLPQTRQSTRQRWRELRTQFNRWQKEEERVWKDRPDRPQTLDYGTGHTRSWWSLIGLREEPAITLAQDLAILRRQLGNVISRERLAYMKEARRKQNELAKIGRLKSVIQSTLGTRHPNPDFQQVDTSDGQHITDPEAVHKYFTGGWAHRLTSPPEAIPVKVGLEPACLNGQLPAADTWEQMLTSEEAFEKAFCDGSSSEQIPVPRHLVQKLGAAFTSNPYRESMERYLTQEFEREIPYEEMRRFIMKSKSTTPGLTGFSYQLMKMLPDECMRDLHAMLSRLWETRTVPEHWTFKALLGIPKKDIPNPLVEDLRPIGLIEVTRKLWTRLILARIFKALKKFAVLQLNQSGGLANMGTDSALVQLLNLLEEGNEEDFDPGVLDFTSWDTRQAYDSLGNHTQYGAWRRLGIPRREVKWLMDLDLEGIFVVLTPYSKGKLRSIKMTMPMSTAHHMQLRSLGFQPKKGLTQGDVKSPLGWIAYFDILLSALKRCRPDDYPKTTIESPELGTIWPSAYMDDLTTATCSHAHTQEVADIVSATNALFGTEAAFGKFRAVSTHPAGCEIIIRTWTWEERKVKFKDALHVIRVLGAKVNVAYIWKQQVKELVATFTRMGNTLHASKVDATAKVKIINLAVVLKAGYGVGMAAWPVKYLNEIDAVLTRMARRSLSLPPSYPSELIHDAEVGFKVQRLKVQVLQAKSRMATRCLEGPGPQSLHMRGLYNRMMRDRLGRLQQGREMCQANLIPKTSFLSTLCLAGSSTQSILTRKGPVGDAALSVIGNHLDISGWPQGVRNFIRNYHIHFTAELIEWESGELGAWIRAPREEQAMTRGMCDCLASIASQIPIPKCIPVRRGHVLEFNWGDKRRYFEVSGYLLEERTLGGTWYTEVNTDETSSHTLIEIMEKERGSQWASGGGRCDLLLIEQQRPALAFRSRTKQSQSFHICGRNSSVRWDTKPTTGRQRHCPITAPWTNRVMDAMAGVGRVPDCLTSDASYSQKEIQCCELWKGPDHAVRRQGAIVLTDALWREGKLHGQGPIMVLIVRNFPESLPGQANGAELVCYLGELQVGTAIAERYHSYPRMETDCNSLIRRSMKEYSRYGQRSLNCRRHGYLYQYARRVNRKWPNGIREWIRSHPERRKGIGAYSGPDARITIVDKYAGSDDPQYITEQLHSSAFKNSRYAFAPEIVLEVDAQEIIEAAFSEGDYYWAVGENGCPATNPLQASDFRDISKYLVERTRHAETGSKFRWHTSQVGLLKYMWKQTKSLKNNWESRAAIQDVFDKRGHQRNVCKGQTEAGLCPLCSHSVDSQAHYALRCPHPLLKVARESFVKQVFERIDKEAAGPGKAFLINRWHWVFDSPPEIETVRRGMHRMAFMLGRPTPTALDCGATNDWIGRTERVQITICVTELWTATLKYMKELWSLRQSILAAPLAVQRRLSVSPATEADVTGMLTRPYSQRDRRKRSQAVSRSLARFCQVRSFSPPSKKKDTELHVSFDDPAQIIQPGSAWQSSWIPWINGYGPVRHSHDTVSNIPVIEDYARPRSTSPDEIVHETVTSMTGADAHASTTSWMLNTEWIRPDGRDGTPCAAALIREDAQGEKVQHIEEAEDLNSGDAPLPPRRNPVRTARPPQGLDLDNWEFADTSISSCGFIPPDKVAAILASEGVEIRRHPDDHGQLWIRKSFFCPNGGFSLFFEAPPGGLRAGYLLAVYDGDSTESLGITYQEALRRWSDSDYVFSDSAHRYVVNGALTCAAARANESFGDTNAKIMFNSKLRRAEIRLGAPVREGMYEGLINYTAPHMPSPYWTKDKLALLPELTQQKANKFYCK